jgi:hypothetical protein
MPAAPAQPPYPSGDPSPFHQGMQNGPYGYQQQGYGEGDSDYDEEFADDEYEPRRGRRWIFITAALVGAIGLGGALAYTYRSIIAPSSGRVPLVKAGDPKVKVRPENRGGKEFANTDKKMLNRLGDNADAQTEETGGPRRVKTIPIVPGGPPAAQPPPEPVPGIMLDNRHAPPVPRPPPMTGQPPPGGRVVIGQPPPALTQEVKENPPPAPARKPPVQPPQAIAKAPAKAPAAKPAPPPPRASTTGSGFVAVLSSQRSRMDALKAFADLQQKYSEALSGKVPDVQEANLGEKGIWYRVVVGPPGSRNAANGVCSQLRSAGYSHCWVNAY